jgi:hypothetical protein
MASSSGSFWSSLQGILTGLAAVITAVTGLYLAVQGSASTTTLEPSSSSVVAQPPKEAAVSVSLAPGLAVPSPTANVTLSPSSNTVTKHLQAQAFTQEHFSRVGKSYIASINCQLFPTPNTSRSLMSWSNDYQQKIVDANGVKARALVPCQKTISYRAQAFCTNRADTDIQNALIDTLQQCQKVGVSWQDAVGK